MQLRPRALAVPISVALAVTMIVGAGSQASAGEPSVVVTPGDTLSGIATHQGVSVEEIVSLNQLSDPDRIFVGQRLQLVPIAAAPEPTAPTPGSATTHLVGAGENLTGIAARYGTTIGELAAANGLANPNLIFAGQSLVIPGASAPAAELPAAEPAPAAPPVAAPEAAPPEVAPAPAVETLVPGVIEHLVAPGENLTWIAARYGTSIGEIVAASAVADPSFIRAGDVLLIPTVVPAPAPAEPAPAADAVAASSAGTGPIPEWMAGLTAQRGDVRQLIVEEASAMGVPPALALAVAWHESGWQQGVVSSAGAVGIMQLLPTTGDWVAEAMLGQPVDINDARSNVRAGVRLLAHYLGRYGGDRALVLAAYYQGERAVDEYGIYPMSLPYIASIVALEAIFGS
jgi:LysM repeat protein